MRAAPFKTYRISTELLEKIQAAARDLGGVSENQVVERCVREMLSLCGTDPAARTVPLMVVQVDAAHAPGKPLRPPNSGPDSPAAGLAGVLKKGFPPRR